MKRLTNLQMSVIVNKIYNELDKEIQAINTKRLESVDMDKLLKKDAVHTSLKDIEALQEEIDSIKKKIVKQLNLESVYYVPKYNDYINRLKKREANLISVDKREIEASVILSDVEDLDSLIKSIKKSMSKNIPELND